MIFLNFIKYLKVQVLKGKTFNKNYKFFLLLTTCFLLLTTRFAYAQGVSLGIWPPILQIMIQPGKSLTQVYKVTSFDDPVIVSSDVSAFVACGEEGMIDLVDCSKVEVIGCESLGWFSFQNADLELGQAFFLGSGRTQEIVLKISAPEYASEGDYYNSLIFTTETPSSLGEKAGKKASRSQIAIVSNILITVSKDGNPRRDINIIDFFAKNKFSIFNFQFSMPIFDSFEPIPVTLRVENTGNAYTSVSGKITLSGFPGLKSDFTILPQNILAGTTRLLQATPSANLQPSFILPKAFYLGRYNLEVRIENADGLSKTTRTSFFALPFKIILGIILLTILIIFIKTFRWSPHS